MEPLEILGLVAGVMELVTDAIAEIEAAQREQRPIDLAIVRPLLDALDGPDHELSRRAHLALEKIAAGQ